MRWPLVGEGSSAGLAGRPGGLILSAACLSEEAGDGGWVREGIGEINTCSNRE